MWQKRRRKGRKDVADAQADARADLADAQRDVGKADSSDDQARAAQQASTTEGKAEYKVAMAQAEADHKVAIEKCERWPLTPRRVARKRRTPIWIAPRRKRKLCATVADNQIPGIGKRQGGRLPRSAALTVA